MKRTHATPFRPDDRIGPLYTKPGETHGTFVMYCRGYLTHCIVKWDDRDKLSRVPASTLRLVNRPKQEV